MNVCAAKKKQMPPNRNSSRRNRKRMLRELPPLLLPKKNANSKRKCVSRTRPRLRLLPLRSSRRKRSANVWRRKLRLNARGRNKKNLNWRLRKPVSSKLRKKK